MYNTQGDVVREEWDYYPKVDVILTAGDSVVKGKQATLSALAQLSQAQITADNWELYAAQLEILDIPDKQKIIDRWKQKFDAGVPDGVVAALGQDPELLRNVMSVLQQRQQMMMGGAPV